MEIGTDIEALLPMLELKNSLPNTLRCCSLELSVSFSFSSGCILLVYTGWLLVVQTGECE